MPENKFDGIKSLILPLVVVMVIGSLIYFMSAEEPNKGTAKEEPKQENKIESAGQNNSAEEQKTPELNIQNNNMETTEQKQQIATIETNKGSIKIKFYPKDAPKTVENFITLAKKGFYDNVIFHRVISGFMIQGGDPTGTGMGGPGYKFEDELNPSTASYQEGYTRGTVAMANSGPNTNGSQFFIMHQDYGLPNNYTIFGKVISGMDVVDAIAATKTNSNDRPLQEIKMLKVTISQE
jgi:cyclophilin family peptidyl-prolyl cis-trans isomerase